MQRGSVSRPSYATAKRSRNPFTAIEYRALRGQVGHLRIERSSLAYHSVV